jgi:uncharacterized protein (DUF1330 family)
MPAYAIFIRESTKDPAEMAAYTRAAGPTLTGHPARVLAAYGRQDVLEGPPPEGVVVVEFPTVEAAREWYDSPAYRAAREHRFRGAEYRAVVIEGV